MSGTRTFGDITDNGLLFRNIRVAETDTGSVNQFITDNIMLTEAPDTTLFGVTSPVPGLLWMGFVAGTTGANSRMSLVVQYDISVLTPTTGLTGILLNTFTPDTVVPAGATLTLLEEVFNTAGTLVGRSLLTKTSTTNDIGDPTFESGDLGTFSPALGNVHVKLTIDVTTTAAVTTPVSFSIMQQAFTAPSTFAALGDYVWLDANGNGLQDDGNTGVAGVTLTLLDSTGSSTGRTTTTDADGKYVFGQLAAGTYSMQISAPAGYALTTTNVLNNTSDATDSDFLAANNRTGPYTLVAGQYNSTVDAGLVEQRTSLSVDKKTNGGDGVTILQGGAVTWTYDVRNTGETPLSNVTVKDDNGTPVDTIDDFSASYISGDSNSNSLLDVGEIWRFSYSGTATADSYSNIATASGIYIDGLGKTRTPTATDPSSYVTVTPSISIEKLTNGVDGAVLLQGSAVTWTYAVRNTGGIALTNVAVSDDKEGAVTNFTGGDANSNGVLDIGETWTYSKAGIASAASYGNIGSVSAKATDGFNNTKTVNAQDPSSYSTVTPSISIEKLTNGVDGAVLLQGSAVTWTYAVRNTGGIALTNVAVSDDKEGAVTNFTGGDANSNGALDIDETWTYSKAGIASAASYGNIGSVSAKATDGFNNTKTVNAQDPSSYVTFTLGSIGDEVFFDRNNNGVRDAGEGLAGVKVGLDIGNDGSIDREVFTDSTGKYLFDNLAAGSYGVVVNGGVAPSGYQNTTDPDGGANSRSTVTLGLSQSNLAQDFGYRAFDFGDAPDTYGTTLAANGPRHVLSTGQTVATPILYLGSLVDAELNGQPSIGADGDDLNGVPNDEDGVTLPTVIQAGPSYQITVRVAEAAGVDGRLTGWIDFNDDGDFLDAGEQILLNQAVVNGDNTFTITVPTAVTLGDTYARFRLSTDTAAQNPTGLALDGEVEDYRLSIGALGSIGDEVFFDRNNNGVRDAGEGLAGVKVGLDIGNDGSIDREVFTDSTGKYLFDNLAAGTYGVVVNGGVAPSGYQNTTDPDGGANSRSTVTLAVGENSLGQDFGYRAYDFGDAPDTYGTTLTDNGARHLLSTGQTVATPVLYLGSLVDAELNGQPSIGADGDDLNGTPDDEDGITLPTVIQAGQTYQITVRVTEASGVDGRLNAWIDFNGDGDFDNVNERILFDTAVVNGLNTLSFTAADTVTLGTTYARFRLSTDAAAQNPTGLALDGEVEDYRLSIGALGSIGDEVFFDRNNNGVRDAGEGLAGVKVGLDIGNDGSIDREVFTDSTGKYLFDNLAAGTYGVVVNGGVAPSGYQNTTDPDGGANSRSTVTLATGQSNLAQDFGYRAFDFGDAPDTYGTTLAANGPRHVLSTGQTVATPILYLGSLVDAELNGQPSIGANGDDLNPIGSPDDEDGVSLPGTPQAGQTYQITVRVAEAAGVDGRLNAWIDYNRDGDFLDAGERIIFNQAVVNGDNTFTVTVPTTVTLGTTYARFRLSTDTAAQNPTGLALDGEVEDYALTLTAAPVSRLDIEKITTGSSNSNTTAPTYDNEDTANGAGVPILTPGSDVTWTYQVRNTGNVAIARNQISIVDDNGTPGNTGDDMTLTNKITYVGGDTNNNNFLDLTETWTYQATGTVQTLTALGTATTFDLQGSTALSGTAGNEYLLTSGGISMKVTGFSRDKSTGSWADAYVGRYGGGVGVTDSGEGTGGNNSHTVDNVGRDNYVLFRFDQNVVVDKAALGYVVNDSDLKIWIGNIGNAFSTTTKLTDAVLTSLGFTELNETTSSSARTADFNAGKVTGNVLVIAANTGELTPNDYFKIQNLTVQAAGPGIYGNIATVSAPNVIGDSDASFYRNPVAPPTVAKLDIEKTTNGSSNSNTTAPTFDNEDTASGAGVPVLKPGSDVTWTYQVKNTGNVAIAKNQISIVDDNGTPGNPGDDMTIANGKITHVSGDTNNNNFLDLTETWTYRATGTVKDLTVAGARTIFDFSGSSALDGQDGNVRSFSTNGLTVEASAFSRDKSSGAWSTAWLGQYGSGLGVTDSSEGDGGGNTHTVDNIGRNNYVLFQFSEKVIVDSAYLGYVVNDSDLTVWIGNTNVALSDTLTLSDAVLSGLGYTELNATTLTSARLADINAAGIAGNVLVIAARVDDMSPEDNFKIDQLTVQALSKGGLYGNIATVSAPNATSDSDASFYKTSAPVAAPKVDIEKLVSVDCGVTFADADSAPGPSLNQGTDPIFRFVVTNTGDVTLYNLIVSDDRLDLNGSEDGTTIAISSLAAGKTYAFNVTGTWGSGLQTNIGTVRAVYGDSFGNTQVVTDSDAANYTGMTPIGGPGVRTPGFWINSKWQDFWDGDAGAPSQAGTKGFASGDILFTTYGGGGVTDPVGGAKKTGLLVGDWNKNGITDGGEKTFFYSVSEALSILSSSDNAGGQDARLILDRALVATWLNFLAGNPVRDQANNAAVFDARDAVDQGIDWLRRYTPDETGDGFGDGSVTLNANTFKVPSSATAWTSTVSGLTAGNTIKNWLDEYNNGGTITYNGVKTTIAWDGDLM
ncbi:SdrD B-like domain-containing protein [Paracraurococcus ruber]|uniref:Serine-aspartate repeat-containing protein D n=1 Tax=Paracraurococcus ruber TaxID=77675 RepID=A0ABS1CTG0_9PROT|nr:SdrD B-like domain-containing protein [Paracraurococcus ruber]MBK1657556.1 hypothetical protein [Paracraurococcus ruber]TDG32074.1 hypothetical protein E2C05_08590 [Paracraurococcus ruber]